ncbi:MAG: hypothetical protein ACP5KD_05055 [Fervidobacterium sp.]
MLYLFSLQLSNIANTLITVCYLVILLLTAEALFFYIKIEGEYLIGMYFKIKVNDIIDIENKLFGVKIRTRWRVYHLPPMEKVPKINRQ